MNVSEIIEAAEVTLLDPTNQYWGVDELLGYINEGQRQIAHLKRDAATETIDHDLQAGARQTLPDDGELLVDVVRNLGVTDFDARPAITAVDMRMMDRMSPNWQQVTDTIVQHYMYDERDRTTFYVYPAQPAAPGRVELRYARRPAVLDNTSDELTLTGDYFSAVLDYVLYRAHSKTSQAAVPQRAAAHYQQFMQQLGLYQQSAMQSTAGERDQQGLR